jgi:uncharacterized protein
VDAHTAVRLRASDGVPLEGRLRRPAGRPRGAALLLHPHPAFGGHMDVWLLPVLAARLAEDGWVALRVNLRGVEGSGGRPTGGAQEHLDAQGALAWLAARVPDVPTAVVGWSFGAMVGLRLGAAVDRWVGIGPPTRRTAEVPLVGPLLPERPPPHRTVVVGEHDQFFPPSTAGVLRPHRLVVLPGADHFLFDLDHVVADVVADELAGARAHP